jgi:RimJ/RimL family protein N-acetyltransferase
MILGKKVRLRAIERGDIPTFLEWINDPQVQRYLGRTPFPISFAEEEKWFERQLTDEKSRIFAIETEKGVHIGNIGLHEIDYKDGRATLGIMIGEKGCWDQGYGTDAIKALLRFAFEELNLHRLYLQVFDLNKRAIRCYEKCGFRQEGVLRESVFRDGRYQNEILMSILRSEFEEGKYDSPNR